MGVWLGWNLLYALPGDELVEYQKTLELIPLLRHLQPPLGLSHLSLERFSPYFMNRTQYGIENLRPIGAYYGFLPEHADVAKIAYHFEGDYESWSKASPQFMEKLEAEISNWRRAWESDGELPSLAVSALDGDCYLLLDTRGVPGTKELNLLNADQARLVLTGVADSPQDLQWALDRKVMALLDSRPVPLVTAELKLFQRFLDEARPRMGQATTSDVGNVSVSLAGQGRRP
ncbi:MAG TPA: hypothetical protein VFA32_08725 [Dehalococcoidia bacterium]|nr:hypothetical protein [Dehalococcoidia bacterium]